MADARYLVSLWHRKLGIGYGGLRGPRSLLRSSERTRPHTTETMATAKWQLAPTAASCAAERDWLRMDASRFNQIVRSLSPAGTRHGLAAERGNVA